MSTYKTLFIYFLFLKKFLFIYFRQRGKKREREGEKHQCVVASCAPPTGNLARNPSMCPDWELNRQPFGLQASPQSTEPQHPGLILNLLILFTYIYKITISVLHSHITLYNCIHTFHVLFQH